jgi:hypothetical protein
MTNPKYPQHSAVVDRLKADMEDCREKYAIADWNVRTLGENYAWSKGIARADALMYRAKLDDARTKLSTYLLAHCPDYFSIYQPPH